MEDNRSQHGSLKSEKVRPAQHGVGCVNTTVAKLKRISIRRRNDSFGSCFRCRRNKYNSLSFMRNLSGSLNRGLLFPLLRITRGNNTRSRRRERKGKRGRKKEKKIERSGTTLIERFTKARDGEISTVSRCDIARERRG